MNASAEMPRYQCHKKVWALKIASFELYPEDDSGALYPADEGYAPFEVCTGWAKRFRGTSDDMGYYVVYDDGYTSWSPSKAFEEGYARISP